MSPSGGDGEIVLYTIGPSHYCEKARWALERLAVSYRESRHPAIVHYAHIAKFRLKTVPILHTPNELITDSHDILLKLDSWVGEKSRLFPEEKAAREEVMALSMMFDERLGPPARRLAYAYLVDDPEHFEEMMTAGVSRFDAATLRTTRGILLGMIGRAFKLKDRARVIAQTRDRITAVFDEVSLRLADSRPYLCGARFSAADLTFASLAAPVIFPPNYAIAFPPIEEVPEGYRKVLREFRATPAGAFAMRLFERDRRVLAPK
jgi:glutathione S-transferase